MTKTKSRVATRPNSAKGIALWSGLVVFGVAALWGAVAQSQEVTIKSHGYNFYGELSYPADYSHFRYVNPDAPKGGEISIATLGTFDSMNPYTRKGRGGALSTVMFESLLGEGVNASAPADVYADLYCLVCESLEYDEGKNWVIFNMRPEAKFSDGSPLTAHDVEFSQQLILEQGLKSYADAVSKRIAGIEVIDDHTIKYTFEPEISRRSLIEVRDWMKADWKYRPVLAPI